MEVGGVGVRLAAVAALEGLRVPPQVVVDGGERLREGGRKSVSLRECSVQSQTVQIAPTTVALIVNLRVCLDLFISCLSSSSNTMIKL